MNRTGAIAHHSRPVGFARNPRRDWDKVVIEASIQGVAGIKNQKELKQFETLIHNSKFLIYFFLKL